MIKIENQETVGIFNYLLLHRFYIEHRKNDRSGIYGLTQKMMAYNSNKIEGSRLTEDQTASLFETGTVNAEGEIIFRAKDIEEMTGHFLMFNEILKTVNEPLTEKLIKKYHYCLKAGVFEDLANGYAVGEYKTRANVVSTITTALPEEVPHLMGKLLSEYHSKRECDLEDLAKFHVQYETIHPFQDGNGRTGRGILFKECLKNNITPFIIKDINKAQYYQGLKQVSDKKDYSKLVQYFKEEQKAYLDLAKAFVIPYNIETIEGLRELLKSAMKQPRIQCQAAEQEI